MNYLQLKEFLDTLTPDQLNQKVAVFIEDNESGHEITYFEISKDTFYWLDGDCLGTKKMAIQELGKKEFNRQLPNMVIVPAGTVTLHSNQ